MVTESLSDPRPIAAEGERIYTAKYQQEFEAKYRGHYVAVDIKSGQAYRGTTPGAAVLAARGASPTGIVHLIKIGDIGAFHS